MFVELHRNERGMLEVPIGLLPDPAAIYEAEQVNGRVVIRAKIRRGRLTEEEKQKKLAAFEEFHKSLPKHDGPPIPLEALRRENMYD